MKRPEVRFTACEQLDFDDHYTANKELISIGGETKVCWNRPVTDDSFPRLVQFCKLRGRMNNPEMCLRESTKGCSDYKNYEHVVNDINVNP